PAAWVKGGADCEPFASSVRVSTSGVRDEVDPRRRRRPRTLSGGCRRTRTFDPLIKSQLLYQLSYTPLAVGAASAATGPSAWISGAPAARSCNTGACVCPGTPTAGRG